jgi:hypothetical protein
MERLTHAQRGIVLTQIAGATRGRTHPCYFSLRHIGGREEDRLVAVKPKQRQTAMSLEEVYNWQGRIRERLRGLGYWQSLVLAMYSLGMVLARQSAPSKVAEKLGMLGKPDSVQRRLERFVDDVRVNWASCCVAWSRWVLERYEGERLILLVDETHLGAHLSVMVVGLAYRSCCVPLAWWR